MNPICARLCEFPGAESDPASAFFVAEGEGVKPVAADRARARDPGARQTAADG